MVVAMPTWNGRVSPVLDVAGRILVVEVEKDAEISRRESDLEESRLTDRSNRIHGLGVEILICGAVSRPLEETLGAAGVRVIPHICGPVEEVLCAFLAGQLGDGAFLMPGCCGRRQRRRWRGKHALGNAGFGRRKRGEPSTNE